MWDSIPGPGDDDLSRRQTFNDLSHPGVPTHAVSKASGDVAVPGTWNPKERKSKDSSRVGSSDVGKRAADAMEYFGAQASWGGRKHVKTRQGKRRG